MLRRTCRKPRNKTWRRNSLLTHVVTLDTRQLNHLPLLNNSLLHYVGSPPRFYLIRLPTSLDHCLLLFVPTRSVCFS